VRFETTHRFEADYRRLTIEERRLFGEAIQKFNAVCDAALSRGGRPQWPRSLRVRDVEGAPGVWEMTWSFSGPDGRATWEWVTVESGGQAFPAIRWRRVGGHAIFGAP
jgi:hypothetical protein